MRKISKISLVAAVAVAGLSTANAQPLEEAIKNVEVSGSVVYRYDNFHNDNKYDQTGNTDSGKNNYKIGLNLSSKVNDYVKFNSRFIIGADKNLGFAGLDAKNQSDTDVKVGLSQAYFALTAIPNTVVNIGKQGLATPYTVAQDINGNEQTGTGILALTNIDVVTLGAGYFNQTNLDSTPDINASVGLKGSNLITYDDIVGNNEGLTGSENLYVATVQADLDYVKLEAWYAGLQDRFNSYTLAATGNLELAENANVELEARYVNLKVDKDVVGLDRFVDRDDSANITNVETWNNDQRKNSMFRLAAAGKFDIVNARVAFTKTGKEGGLTALDQDAKNSSLGWALSSNGIADAKYWQAALGADILDNLNFTAHYGNLKSKDSDYGFDLKAQEYFGQLTYKMSKNLSTYVRYGKAKVKEYSTGDRELNQNRGRIQVAYTF